MVSLSLKLPDHGLEELPSKDVFGSLIRSKAVPHRPIEEGEAKGPRVLTQLVLCFNELQDVTQLGAMPELSALVELDLRHNKLHSLAGVEALQSLRILKACGNSLRSLQQAASLPALGRQWCSSAGCRDPSMASRASSRTCTSRAIQIAFEAARSRTCAR